MEKRKADGKEKKRPGKLRRNGLRKKLNCKVNNYGTSRLQHIRRKTKKSMNSKRREKRNSKTSKMRK